jgi:pilus assembly protein CpaB
MKRGLRTAVVLVVAIAVAGLASFGVYRAIANIPVREVEIAHVFAVVAAKSLPAGAMLSKDDVRVVPWPAASPMPGAFTQADAVAGRGLVAAVVENEPITESKLAPKGAGAGLPPTIPSGMRAMSVKVNEVIGVAGFVLPGNRVDVLVTVNQEQDPVARTIVPNILVLTAGTRYDQEQAKDGKPVPSTVVTLAVTPQDAERIAVAAGSGSIVLALRNPLDVGTVETTGARMSGLFSSASPTPAVAHRARRVLQAPPLPPPAPSIYNVEAIKAGKRAQEVVR